MPFTVEEFFDFFGSDNAAICPVRALTYRHRGASRMGSDMTNCICVSMNRQN